MPYYGRQVARLKGVGKYINWNQGGGPKKAGLGPQINVSTWGRRVISRRTNNCCCDPIELTSVQMSIPRITPIFTPPGGTVDPGTIAPDIPWNQWTPVGGENGGGGYVGPPRNDVCGNVINPVNQIYAIFTFNKPITASSPPYKYNPTLPNGTAIEVIGLEEVADSQSGTGTPLGLPVKMIDKKTGETRFYKLNSKTTPVTQIPGGTEVRTFAETVGRLTDGSRFLIDHEIVTGVGTLSKFDLNSSKARLLPDMQSGLNNAQQNLYSPTNYWDRGPPQKDISSYGAFNRRLDYEERGGFAPQKAVTSLPLTGGVFDFTNTNHFLGNIFGVYSKQNSRAFSAYDYANWPNQTLNINPNLPQLNLRLVQSNPAVGTAPNVSCLVENYSADAAYISKGRVSWLDNQHALFINITSIMQIMLRNCTANAVADASGVNTTPAGQGWTGNVYPSPAPDLTLTGNRFGVNGAPPMPKYFAGNPLSVCNGTTTASGPAFPPGQVGRPAVANPPGNAVSDWTNSRYNNGGKYATWPKDAGLQPLPLPIVKAGPWQIGGIDGNFAVGLFPTETKLPAWTDATWNQIGYNRPVSNGSIGQQVNQMRNGVTIDSGGQYNTLAPAAGFETYTFETAGLIDNTLRYSSYHILYYGHVIEKMRQLTYAGFGSYIVRDVLSSKYRCGNDGFDGPVSDIIIPSGDRRITTTDDTTEAGLLTFASNVPLAAASSAATPALPPTAGPSPPANPPSGPTGPIGPINPNPPLSPIGGGGTTPAPTSPISGGGSGGGGAVPVPTPINPGGGFGGGGLGSF